MAPPPPPPLLPSPFYISFQWRAPPLYRVFPPPPPPLGLNPSFSSRYRKKLQVLRPLLFNSSSGSLGFIHFTIFRFTNKPVPSFASFSLLSLVTYSPCIVLSPRCSPPIWAHHRQTAVMFPGNSFVEVVSLSPPRPPSPSYLPSVSLAVVGYLLACNIDSQILFDTRLMKRSVCSRIQLFFFHPLRLAVVR